MRVLTATLMLCAFAAILLFGEKPSAIAMTQDASKLADESLVEDAAVAKSNWKLDNKHSSMVFAVSHSGLSYIYGRFNEVAGAVRMDSTDPTLTKFQFTIDPKSIDTNDADRDDVLRSEQFLDVTKFGLISFESTDVDPKVVQQTDGSMKRTFNVGGNLTMHGETRRISLPIDFLAMGKGVDGVTRCGFISKFVVRRSDHGLDAMPETIGDSLAITFCFQVVQQPPEPAGEKENAVAPKSLEETGSSTELEIDSANASRRKRIEELFR